MVSPHQVYTYDALYRLVLAEGREHISNTDFNNQDNYNDSGMMLSPAPLKWDINALQTYIQRYRYDAVGNILELKHIAINGGYTRAYTYATDNNRLTRTTVGTNNYNYNHDVRGNMTGMPHLSVMHWNRFNEMDSITNSNMQTWYQYSGGQRVRKYVEKSTGVEERIYLGNFEIYRKFDALGSLTPIVERTTVHVSDDTGRIAMIELRNPDYGSDGSEDELTRYIYSNHLQSATLELNELAEVISYEEYHPYGTTAYQAYSSTINATAKRYRYTGKERDEESGLYYHGARYYVPWLCRWTAVDPINQENYNLDKGYGSAKNKERDFLELCASTYEYCYDNPVGFTDSSGEQPPPIRTINNRVGLQRGPEPITDNGHPLGPQDIGEGVRYMDRSDEFDNTGAGHNSATVRILSKMFSSKKQGRPFTAGDSARIQMVRAQRGEVLPSNISNAYTKIYAAKAPLKLAPPQKITTDISKLTDQDRKNISQRVMSGNATAQDRIYLGQMIKEGLLAIQKQKLHISDINEFMEAQMDRIKQKLGKKLGKGELPFKVGKEGFQEAIESIKTTLSNPTEVTDIIPKSNLRGDYDLIHVFSERSGNTVSLRVLDNGKYEFDTIIHGKSSKFK